MDRTEFLATLKKVGEKLGHSPTEREFREQTALSSHSGAKFFPKWSGAFLAAGLQPDLSHARIDDEALLRAWADVIRKIRRIPTMAEYPHMGGAYSVAVFKKRFGPWSELPDRFREICRDNPEYADVLALLPSPPSREAPLSSEGKPTTVDSEPSSKVRHVKLDNRPTYGNPLGFRGLRHEPVNEQGVVFLFGMVAHEMGYLVEAVQEGFPDCEAKRQIGPGKWQRVRIEFEYESRTFRDHGHSIDGCDIIVCWRHNWPECPPHLEVVELSSVIKSLPKSEE